MLLLWLFCRLNLLKRWKVGGEPLDLLRAQRHDWNWERAVLCLEFTTLLVSPTFQLPKVTSKQTSLPNFVFFLMQSYCFVLFFLCLSRGWVGRRMKYFSLFCFFVGSWVISFFFKLLTDLICSFLLFILLYRTPHLLFFLNPYILCFIFF